MSQQLYKDNNHRMLKLQEFLRESPNDCFLLHALALEHHKENNVDEAINLFEKVLEINPKYVGSYYQLGKMYELKGFEKKAVEVYEEGIKMATAERDFLSLNELRAAIDLLLE